jgi:hypothetical protein
MASFVDILESLECAAQRNVVVRRWAMPLAWSIPLE